MVLISLVQMRKKFSSLSTINDMGQQSVSQSDFNFWKPLICGNLQSTSWARWRGWLPRDIAIECQKIAASNCQKSHSKNHHVPKHFAVGFKKGIFFVLCFLGINLNLYSQNGNLPQAGVKKNIYLKPPPRYGYTFITWKTKNTLRSGSPGKTPILATFE